MGLGDLKTCVYQLIFDKNDSNDSKNTILIIYALGLCNKSKGFWAHMLYVWSFSHNISVPIATNQNVSFLSLNTYNTVFAWGDGSSNII